MPDSSPENEIKTDDQVQAGSEVEQKTDGQDPAASSSAEDQGGGKPKDLLTTVRAALDKAKTEKTPDSNEPGSKSEEEPAADAKKDGDEAGEESDDLTEEELSRLRPKTRKRIDNLLRDRSDRDRQIAELQPKADQFAKIVDFVDGAGLSKEEVNQGFNVMRDLKNDPLKAYEYLKPIMSQLAVMAGDVLPDDLRQEVAFGRITEAHARDLVLARSRSTILTDQTQRNQQAADEQRKKQDHQTQVDEVSGAVSDWERSKEKSDPSWKLKQPRVMELVELEIARRQRTAPNYFPTKAEALQFSNDALKRVEDEFKKLAPRPKAITPSPDAGSTRASAAPKSMLEAARRGLNSMAG